MAGHVLAVLIFFCWRFLFNGISWAVFDFGIYFAYVSVVATPTSSLNITLLALLSLRLRE